MLLDAYGRRQTHMMEKQALLIRNQIVQAFGASEEQGAQPSPARNRPHSTGQKVSGGALLGMMKSRVM